LKKINDKKDLQILTPDQTRTLAAAPHSTTENTLHNKAVLTGPIRKEMLS
jgi:hypothetical protein